MRVSSQLAGKVLAAIMVLCALTTNAFAQEVTPAKLNDTELLWLDRAENYLNEIDSMRARFLQIAPDGGIAEGTFYLRRPGRLRVEYEPPVPILIVGDGIFLHYQDKELGQINDWPIFDTPIGSLSRDEIRFNEDLVVTGLARRSGVLAVTIVQRADPGLGDLTLVFQESPMVLRQWRVIDAQGQATTISLHELETNVEISAKLFVFDDPRETRPQR